jgi:hypothetical protein
LTDDRSAKGKELVVRAGAALPVLGHGPEAYYQSLWFVLARRNWRSLALVPADENQSAAGVATALVDVGRRLRRTPVTFLVMAGFMDYASAGQFLAAVVGKDDAAQGAAGSDSRVIVAVPPVLTEPLALAVTEAVDAVALYVNKGQTRRKAAQQTIELIGRDRIVGCVLA